METGVVMSIQTQGRAVFINTAVQIVGRKVFRTGVIKPFTVGKTTLKEITLSMRIQMLPPLFQLRPQS